MHKSIFTGTDILHGPLGKNILLYALPFAATGILQQLFTAADTVVVGRFVGKDAMAAVGANSPIIGLIITLFIGISLGTNVVIATAIGRRDSSTIQKAVHTSVLFSLLGGAGVGVLGVLAATPLLEMLSVPPEILPMAALYLRIYCLGMPVIFLYNFEAAIFRAAGDTRTPLTALTVSGSMNVVLNILFVVAFHMTAEGVALATVISNAFSSVFLLQKLIRTDGPTRFSFRLLRIDRTVFIQIIRIGLPAGLQGAVFSIANIVIQTAINSLGSTVMAASAAAFNLETFAYYILNAFGQTCTTFVGQNFGAGNIQRCKQSLKICLIQNCIICAAVVLLILTTGKFLLSFFTKDPEVIDTGYVRLAIIFTAYIFSVPGEVLSGYLRGYGLSLIPSVLSMIGACGIRLFWIFVVFPLHPAFSTIMTVYPISLGASALLVLFYLLYKRPAKQFGQKV